MLAAGYDLIVMAMISAMAVPAASVSIPAVGVTLVGSAFATVAAATLAGAVGLGLAAIARAKRRGKFRHYHHVHKPLYGHGLFYRRRRGFGGHAKYNKRSGYRKKRSVDESWRIEQLLKMIREEDGSQCGLKLVCELAANPHHRLSEEERAILYLIGPSIKPGEGLLPKGARGEYQFARGLGETGHSCSNYYYTCPFGGEQLINLVHQYLP